MAMNFYKQQEQARRQEKIMFALFLLLSLLLTMVITKAIDWAFLGKLSLPSLLTINILLLATIYSVSFDKVKKLLATGNRLADSAGGSLLEEVDNSRKTQLRNIIEEMAIAAGVPVPHIYVLKKEPSINAFAVGLKPTDMAIGVTQGCLDYLNRDELQAVMAYEMGQIINGYTRLNTLMYGVLFGLQFLYSFLEKNFLNTMNQIQELKTQQENKLLPYFGTIITTIILLPLYIVAYLGHLSAKMIKSIICRENVFKMDATAVQLSRHPDALASALNKSLKPQWKYILFADDFSTHLEHLLFTFGNDPVYEFEMLRTHPETGQRIQKILPSWQAILKNNDEPLSYVSDEQTKITHILGSRDSSAYQTLNDLHIIPTIDKNQQMVYDTVATAAVLGIIGGMNETALTQTEIKDEAYWRNAARQPEQASAVVVAMLARHSDNKQACLAIAELFSQELHNHIKALLENALPDEQRFAVLAIALPNLRLNVIGEENINKYKKFLQQIIKADDKMTLFEHCVYAAVSGSLKTSLMAGFLSSIPKDKLKQEIIELLALTATHCNHSKNAEQAFTVACVECRLGLMKYNHAIPLGRLSSLLQKLDHLSITDKKELLTALNTIANFDETLDNSEKDWLSAVAIAWGMPTYPNQ
ncbi:MAG: M48 family metalloprotease [Neisseriaceae bacterium]|nr:M48 family metalloprotease [Neisseriaceae bacterium]